MLQNSSSDDEEEDDKTEGTVCSLQQQGSSRGDICLPWGGGGVVPLRGPWKRFSNRKTDKNSI